MQHPNYKNSNLPPDGPMPGLEDHLRNLILNNADSPADNPTRQQPRRQTEDEASLQHNLGPLAPSPLANRSNANISARGGRRRPNQAQRRQMSSQLSIPIDPNANQQQDQHSSAHSNHRVDYASNSSPAFQRHQHTYSNPHGGASPWRHRQDPDSRGSWGGEAHRHQGYNNNSGYQHHQSAASVSHSERSSFPARGRYGHSPYHGRQQQKHVFSAEEIAQQSALLDQLCYNAVSNSEIERPEIAEKEAFRQRIEEVCRQTIARFEYEQNQAINFPPQSVELKCFGSLSSGFATKASDMDLGLLSPCSQAQPDTPGSPIPRLLEKALLEAGFGARLLSRTRVPIIKLCEHPPELLRQGLLAERAKWDTGIATGQEDGQDDGDEEQDHEDNKAQDPLAENTLTNNNTTANADEPTLQPLYFEVPTIDGQTQRYHLRQGTSHSLTAYYGLAKRVLRKAGGRDVTMSNYRDFSTVEWEILNCICVAFVEGLQDSNLRDSLLKSPSFSFSKHQKAYRSLIGVFAQVEGQQALQLWESSALQKSLQPQRGNVERSIESWRDLQQRVPYSDDPIAYAKDLQLALERMKKAPVIQLVTLEQTSQETALQYYSRTVAIVGATGLKEPELDAEQINAICSLYACGIYQEELREQLVSLLKTGKEIIDVHSLGRKHMALQLADDFERALGSKFFTEESISDIQTYISLLKAPLSEVSQSVVALHVPQELIDTVGRIRQLPDPHKMLPSQSRDRYRDHLEFPKTGAGTQCDINFSAHLALQNTLLLRCYSHTDPRVRPMVLFIKHWAKCRGINSGYRGTLSSYGFVLMVLHYLVNVVQPFVSPNLQQVAPPGSRPGDFNYPEAMMLKGYNIQFWRNENEIIHMALNRQLTSNTQSIGHLLRGFFEYFAQNGAMSTLPGRGFDWGRDVLSLRTMGGLLTKQEKGWTGAKTVYQTQESGDSMGISQPQPKPEAETNSATKQPEKASELKEVRLRYLFAIEDPFELDHNVARTVTHNGIVSIRDEFRRAWRIIQAAGQDIPHDDLLQDTNDVDDTADQFAQVINEIHGWNTV